MEHHKINLENVTKIYGNNISKVIALEEISLRVHEDEIVSVVGPSGCGKTTLINLIAGFLLPTSGRVLIDGEEVNGRTMGCGVVFQADSVFPWMTVEENISYGLRAKKTPPKKTKEIVESFMELVGLNDFSNCWPRELSGGMRKRVDLARAYAFDPTILLMDEPFGSLDVQTKEEMQSLLLRLWQTKRKTMVFVTHDVEEAIFLSKRVVVLSARPGTIKEIVEIPFDNSRTPSLKLTPAFLELRRRVLNNLMNSDMKFSVSKI